jgi:uncharacterized repeat protein (TIGR03806 family)
MNKYGSRAAITASLALALAAAVLSCTRPAPYGVPYGLTSRIETQAYLHMPPLADGKIPLLLSETGAFSDTAKLIPSAGLIPYELIVPFWSDGADKSRWVAVPHGKIAFAPTGEWSFPAGTVFVKTFDLPTDAADPSINRRLETRLLVRDSAGGVYGVVYKWRSDGSDADLLGASETEDIPVRSANGEVRPQTWYYPSRKDCLTCHTTLAGGILGMKTRQMNRPFTYPAGVTDNELRAWNHIGLFTPGLKDEELVGLPRLVSPNDASRALEDRARSYLDANCSQCHRPGGTVAEFDTRYDTPLDRQGLIDAPVLIDQGIDRPRVISPHDIWRSIAYMRMNTLGDIKMPPVARETIDQRGVQLLNAWITGMPGRSVLSPPAMSPPGGSYHSPVDVSLTLSEPGAEIRYTLDGSAPGRSDLLYEKPIKLTQTAILRARAYKDGFTRSITEQQVFVIEK